MNIEVQRCIDYQAWVCVDSLVALLNLASEISQSGKFASADSHDLTSVAPSARRSEDEASYEVSLC